MKTTVNEYNYAGEVTPNGGWWRWNEYCDSCGAKIHGLEIMHSMKPDETEADYCIDCLKVLLQSK